MHTYVRDGLLIGEVKSSPGTYPRLLNTPYYILGCNTSSEHTKNEVGIASIYYISWLINKQFWPFLAHKNVKAMESSVRTPHLSAAHICSWTLVENKVDVHVHVHVCVRGAAWPIAYLRYS